MTKAVYSLILALALVTAYSVSQTREGMSNPQGQTPPSPTAPDASQRTPGDVNNPSNPPATDQTPSPDTQNQAKTEADKENKMKADDQALHSKVHDQLATDPAFSNVQVKVKNGKVKLTGTVASDDERKRAVQMAESVPGVRKVKDKLKVSAAAGTSPSGTRSNEPTSAGAATTPSASGETASATGAASAPSQTTSTGAQTPSAGTSTTGGATTGTTTGTVAGSTSTGTGTTSTGTTSGTTAGTAPQTTPSTGATGTATAPSTAPSAGAGATAGTTSTGQPSTAGSISGNTQGTTTSTGATTPSTGVGTTGGTTTGTTTQGTTAGGTTAGGTATGTAGTGTSATEGQSSTLPQSSGLPQSDTGTTASAESSSLQKQIDAALKKEPTLANSNVNVMVTDTTVELSGSVSSGKEKQTAKRIAQSFAGNRRVVDRVTVTGRGANAPSGSTGTSDMNRPNGTSGTSNPSSTTPEPNKGTTPRSNPQTQGDQSSTPRL
jgi:osmotically-inducible protein OsmY